MTVSKTDWNSIRRQIAKQSKETITEFILRFMQCHGMSVQFGSGSLHGIIADRLIQQQVDSGNPLDLTIYTHNEDVAARIRAAKLADPILFANTELETPAGEIDKALQAQLSHCAAKGIATPTFRPAVTLVTAFGISFTGDVNLTYKFDRELLTAEALVTRPTQHRIIAGDHSKIGKDAFHRLCVDLRRLVEDTERLSFVITRPSELSPSFAVQVDNLQGMLTTIADREADPARGDEVDAYHGVEIDLFILDENDHRNYTKFSLDEERKKAAATRRGGDPKPDWRRLDPQNTVWFCDGQGPHDYDEVSRWVDEICDPNSRARVAYSYHLACSQCEQYTTFFEFTRQNIHCRGTKKPTGKK